MPLAGIVTGKRPAPHGPLRPCIYVLAGVNGAGKSSIGGAAFRHGGVDYFNPDEAARRIQSANPGIVAEEANSLAWHQGRRLLERAITERLDFAFETTLGGTSIPRLLETALASDIDVRIWFVGLTSPELHLERVRQRVARGGHDIPEDLVRERFTRSRLNLVRLLPHLTELRVHDNSAEGDPARGGIPRPRLILHVAEGTVRETCPLEETPDWAKPIVMAALRLP
jgi:predicted ABC-type ATPase